MQRQTKCCWRTLELLSLAGQDRFQCCKKHPAINFSHHPAATALCLPGEASKPCPRVSLLPSSSQTLSCGEGLLPSRAPFLVCTAATAPITQNASFRNQILRGVWALPTQAGTLHPHTALCLVEGSHPFVLRPEGLAEPQHGFDQIADAQLPP